MDTLAELKLARDNESKSSAGDKHETGRAMVQAEIQRAEEVLAQAESLTYMLESIEIKKQFTAVEKGALLKVNGALYFVSAGLGMVEILKQDVYCISLGSPLGILMVGKEFGDAFDFRGKSIKIESIEWHNLIAIPTI